MWETYDHGGGVVTCYIKNIRSFFRKWYANVVLSRRARPVTTNRVVGVNYWDTAGTPVMRMKLTYAFIQFPGLHVQPSAPDSAICYLLTACFFGGSVTNAVMGTINTFRASILESLKTVPVIQAESSGMREIPTLFVSLSDMKGAAEEFEEMRSSNHAHFPSLNPDCQNRMHYDDLSPACRRPVVDMFSTPEDEPHPPEPCQHSRAALIFRGVPGSSVMWFYGRHGQMHVIPRLSNDILALLDKQPQSKRFARYLSGMFPASTWYPFRYTDPAEWDARVAMVSSAESRDRITRSPRPPHGVQLDAVKRFLMDYGPSLLKGRPEAPKTGEKPFERQRINPETVRDALTRSGVFIEGGKGRRRLVADVWITAVEYCRSLLHYDKSLSYTTDVPLMGRSTWWWWKRIVCTLWPWEASVEDGWYLRLVKNKQVEQARKMSTVKADMRRTALWVAPYVYLMHGCDLYEVLGEEAAEVTEEPLEHIILRAEFVAAAMGERPTQSMAPMKIAAIMGFGSISLWPPISSPGLRIREASSKSYGTVSDGKHRGGDVRLTYGMYAEIKAKYGMVTMRALAAENLVEFHAKARRADVDEPVVDIPDSDVDSLIHTSEASDEDI